ncbi:hypothetical protein V3C99_016583, partial [Haemonchus contortus]
YGTFEVLSTSTVPSPRSFFLRSVTGRCLVVDTSRLGRTGSRPSRATALY